jgi:hypothetical protein
MTKPDLQFENSGGVCILQPLTPKGRKWIQKHVAFESWQLVGSTGIAVDHRMVGDLQSQATAFGLIIKERKEN